MKTLMAAVGDTIILFPNADDIDYVMGGIRVARKDETFYLSVDQVLPVRVGEINLEYDIDAFHEEMAKLTPLTNSGEPRERSNT